MIDTSLILEGENITLSIYEMNQPSIINKLVLAFTSDMMHTVCSIPYVSRPFYRMNQYQ